MRTARAAGLAASLAVLCAQAPYQLKADGQPIEVDVGHAAPYVFDFDGDGKRDLLVGQFGDGQLRIYRNTGTNQAPVYAAHEWFEAGGGRAKVPAG